MERCSVLKDKSGKTSAWEQTRRWLETLSQPRVQQLTAASVWTARGVAWRQRARRWSLTTQESFRRLDPAFKLPFFAASTAPALRFLLDPHHYSAQEIDEREYSPPTAAHARIVVNPTSGSVTAFTLRDLRETAEWL